MPWLLKPTFPANRSTSRLPCTNTLHAVSRWMRLIHSPPLPMTAPTQCAGHMTVMHTSLLSSRTIPSTISSAFATDSASPTTITRRGASSSSCPTSSCSHTILAPVFMVICCKPRPSLPRSLWTTLRGTSLALLMSRFMCAVFPMALRSDRMPMLPE